MIRNAVLSKALIVFTLHFCLLSQAAAAEAGWEAEWERTVKAAEQEGQVTVYKIAHDAEWHAFQKQYPKIKVNLVPASAAQIQKPANQVRR